MSNVCSFFTWLVTTKNPLISVGYLKKNATCAETKKMHENNNHSLNIISQRHFFW